MGLGVCHGDDLDSGMGVKYRHLTWPAHRGFKVFYLTFAAYLLVSQHGSHANLAMAQRIIIVISIVIILVIIIVIFIIAIE